MKTKLTMRQQKFIDYFILTGNASEAARRAGYSEKFAGQNADRLVKNKAIEEQTKQRVNEAQAERIADIKEVLECLTDILRGNAPEQINITEVRPNGKENTKIIKKTASNRDRLKAAEMLQKHFEKYGENKDNNNDGLVDMHICFKEPGDLSNTIDLVPGQCPSMNQKYFLKEYYRGFN